MTPRYALLSPYSNGNDHVTCLHVVQAYMLTPQAAASVPMPVSNLHDYGALPDALQSNTTAPLLQIPQLCCA